MEDKRAQGLIEKFDELKSERYSYEHNWQDIRELVRPGTSDFQAERYKGDVRTEKIYDGTAPQSLVELAGALHAFLTSPVDRWFILETIPQNNDPEALLWLEDVSDRIYQEYSREDSTFNSALQESYKDLGSFGTCVINQENIDGLRFRSMALADCWLSEDSTGKVDGVYRKVMLNSRQLLQQFPEAPFSRDIKEGKDKNRKYEILHMVFPRTDRLPFRLDQTNMPLASFWVMKEPDKMVLKESGFRTMPYHVGRWDKLSMETYGRGPAINCLPDIKMLNRMEFTNIKAAQKAVDPPLMVPSDGYLMPLRAYPGAMLMREPGAEKIEAVPTSDKLLIGLEYTEQKRQFIKNCFFSDWVKLMPKKERQTAFEIAELVEQQLRMMAPMLGRIQAELLGPLIERSYFLMLQSNQLPPPPQTLSGQRLKVVYTSTAAQAQKGQKALGMARYSQELLPMAQVDPTIMDAVDTDAYAQELALIRGVSRRILRSPEAILGIREAREQQRQAAMIAENMEPASKAVKNLADAGKSTGVGL
jgi:hypothetical protein